MTIIDIVKGRNLKTEGMERVDANEGDEYREVFARAFAIVLSRDGTITADAVREIIPPSIQPCHPNAIGAMFRGLAVRAGLRKIGYRQSSVVSRHAGEIAVWGPE